MRTELVRSVAAGREELVGLCGRLVAAASVSPPGDTREAAAVVAEHLRLWGVEPQLVAAVPEMPSVLACVDGRLPGRHVVLTAHLDTLPPGDEALWSVPPFALTRVGGRLHGLGMSSTKGAVAAMVLAFVLLAERRATWAGRLTITAVSDACAQGERGAAHLLASRPDETIGDALISGEGPGPGLVALGERGIATYEVTARADGSGDAGLAAALRSVQEMNGRRGTAPAALGAVRPPEALALALGGDPVDPPTLQGGVAATVDVLVPPGITMAEVEAELDARLRAHPGVRWRRISGREATWSGLEEPFVAGFAEVVDEVRGRPVDLTVSARASDAGRWRSLRVPAVGYGLGAALTARTDESVEEQDVVDCATVYALAAFDHLST